MAILGFSFKANTNDVRESPSINISKDLLQEGAQLAFYDPKVNKKQIISEFINYKFNSDLMVCESALQASENADAILILTEWDEFKYLNWSNIYEVMRKPAWIFDSRICLDRHFLKGIGFNVWTLGKV